MSSLASDIPHIQNSLTWLFVPVIWELLEYEKLLGERSLLNKPTILCRVLCLQLLVEFFMHRC
jgi:hypothetical protein